MDNSDGALHVRRPGIFFTIVDDELIIMAQDQEAFYASNAIASTLWNALETPISTEGLCDVVLENFEGVERDALRADVTEFLDTLRERELLGPVQG